MQHAADVVGILHTLLHSFTQRRLCAVLALAARRMSSQSWNSIPEARRKALAARLRTTEEEEGSDDDEIEKPEPTKSKSGELSGSGTVGKTSNVSSQELGEDKDLLKQHSTKLETLETRLEKLVTLNESLAERSKRLEDLVLQVAEHVGVSHDLDGSAKK